MDKRNDALRGKLNNEGNTSREESNNEEVSQVDQQLAEPIRPPTPDTWSPPSTPSSESLNPRIENESYILCTNVQTRSEDTMHAMRGSVANLQSTLERGYRSNGVESLLYTRLWGYLSEVRHNLDILMHDREYLIVTELLEEGINEGGMSRPRVSPLGFPPRPSVPLPNVGRIHYVVGNGPLAGDIIAYPPTGIISCYRPPGTIDEDQLMTCICRTPVRGNLACVFTQAETFARGLTVITFMGGRTPRVYELAMLIRSRVPAGVLLDCPLWVTILEAVCERGCIFTAQEVAMTFNREFHCNPSDLVVWNLPGLQCTNRHFRIRCPIGLARRAIRRRYLIMNDGYRRIMILATPWTLGEPDRVWQIDFNQPRMIEQMFCITCGEPGYEIRTCIHPYLYPHAIISQEDGLPHNINIIEELATFGSQDDTDRMSRRRRNRVGSNRTRNNNRGRRSYPPSLP